MDDYQNTDEDDELFEDYIEEIPFDSEEDQSYEPARISESTYNLNKEFFNSSIILTRPTYRQTQTNWDENNNKPFESNLSKISAISNVSNSSFKSMHKKSNHKSITSRARHTHLCEQVQQQYLSYH